MLTKLLKLNGVIQLDRIQQKKIMAGEGPYVAVCKSGARIPQVPDTDQSTLDWACSNHGGSKGWICSGSEC